MRKTKQLVQVAFAFGVLMLGSQETQATEVLFPKTTTASQVKEIKDAPALQRQTTSTKSATDGFAADEYVRVTQPDTSKTIKTFDQEINIMGEARQGVEIKIVTYVSDDATLASNITEDLKEYTVYKLNKVGATQTFSQLIKLHEGYNHIIIYYTYAADNIQDQLAFIIDRESEEVKQQIKTFIVNDPNLIINKLSPQ